MKLKIHLSLLLVCLSFAFSGYSQHYQDTINAARNASNQGQYKKALKYYKSAERITPKEVDLSQEMGQTAYKAGDFETAERCFDDWEDEQIERDLQRAGDCKCGAWQFSSGKIIHVADCCCGAD